MHTQRHTTQPKTDWTGQVQDAALAFAAADFRWRVLSASRENWTEPDRRRALAGAFLRYHSAKLALEAAASVPGSGGG